MGLTPNQYQAIMKAYDQNRSNALRIQQEHLAEVRAKISGYSDLEDEASHIAIQYGKRLIDDPKLSLSDMDSQLALLTKRKQELLLSNGYKLSYIEPAYVCPDCEDTGYINGTKCHCFLKTQIEYQYSQSNIRELLKTENFEHLSDEYYSGEDLATFKKVVEKCKDFVSNFDTNYDNLMLTGNVGVGKSFLSGCIAHALIESGHSVLYFSAVDLFAVMADNTFHRNYSATDGDDDIANRELYECDLLVIDDLGTEVTNSFVCSSIFTCLNERHLRHKSTIINTNLSLSDLHERYSDRVFSRAVGNYELIKLVGPDIRIAKHNLH